MEQVLEMGLDGTSVRPEPLERWGTVLSVWAHPDDEAYLAGGFMAALREAGQRVVCVTATRGEAADPSAAAAARAELARVRARELTASLTTLGVSEHRAWDLPDGGCADLEPGPVVAALRDVVDEVRPDTVITFGPDGFTGHPDHRTVSRWVDLAVDGHRVAPRVLHAVAPLTRVDAALDAELDVFALGEPRACRDEEVALRVHLEGPALERKVAALLAQASQTSAVVAHAGRERFGAWVATEYFAAPVESRSNTR
jgi:LmbE family N-acetylglucosaminyl deacetylase